MLHSYFGKAPDATKVALPYVAIRGLPPQAYGYGFHDVPDNWIGAGAGGLLCSAKDISIWMSYLLRLANNNLRAEDPVIIKPETYQEIMRGRCLSGDTLLAFPAMPGESAFPESSPAVYALALWRSHYRGVDITYHGGKRRSPLVSRRLIRISDRCRYRSRLFDSDDTSEEDRARSMHSSG